MYLDAVEDNQDCSVDKKTYAHGSEACDKAGLNCKICIDGWWVDKLRGHRNFCPSQRLWPFGYFLRFIFPAQARPGMAGMGQD